MPSAATRIAREIHRLASSEKRSVTPLELMKLTYLAHGWSLGLRNKPLVADTAEAWQYGPVYPELYHALKHYRASPVQEVPGSVYEWRDNDLSDEDRSFVKAVFEAYKGFNGVQLSSLTHQPGTPWQDAWDRRGRNTAISNDAILSHYRQLASERGAA